MSIPVVLYRYDASPYAHKVDNALILKKVAHHRVNVSPVLPRPEIADILGIPYRRIPLLAIGNDIYCDTSLIVSTLERRFPASQGFGTLFPARNNGGSSDTGLIKAFSKFYIDSVLFPLGSLLLPWEKLPESFVKDRGELRGAPLNVPALIARRDKTVAQLSANLVLVEEQLSDGRTWLFDTETPSLADVSIHFVLAWSRAFPASKALFQGGQFAKTQEWLARLTSYLNASRQTPTKITGEEAGKLVLSSSYEPYSTVDFDAVEAKRLGVALNDIVSIAPDDTGRGHPTTGRLVALSKEEITLEIAVKSGLVRCHFPRLGYVIGAPKSPAKL